jgi:hypothetical protein
MYGPTIFEPFRPLLSGASAESWAQDGCRPKSHYDNADSVQQLHVQQPSTYARPEAASAVSGS